MAPTVWSDPVPPARVVGVVTGGRPPDRDGAGDGAVRGGVDPSSEISTKATATTTRTAMKPATSRPCRWEPEPDAGCG